MGLFRSFPWVVFRVCFFLFFFVLFCLFVFCCRWLQADDPFQALACAYELHGMLSSPCVTCFSLPILSYFVLHPDIYRSNEPENFVSHLPIHMVRLRLRCSLPVSPVHLLVCSSSCLFIFLCVHALVRMAHAMVYSTMRYGSTLIPLSHVGCLCAY